MEFEVDAPRVPLSASARVRYAEVFRADDLGWYLDKYHYDYLDFLRGGRFAYHRHDVGGQAAVFHIHCEPTGGSAAEKHHRAYEVDLLEAHDEFVERYVSDKPVDCRGERALTIQREFDR